MTRGLDTDKKIVNPHNEEVKSLSNNHKYSKHFKQINYNNKKTKHKHAHFTKNKIKNKSNNQNKYYYSNNTNDNKPQNKTLA